MIAASTTRSESPEGIHPPPGSFATTRWTLVLLAQGESESAGVALGELCVAYWRPVFEFIRRDGRDAETARELTQEFFARILARRGLGSPDPARGRFRSFLLGAVKHFLGDIRDRERAQRRGGGQIPVPLSSNDGSAWGEGGVERGSDGGPEVGAGELAVEPSALTFDREWAVDVVNRAVTVVTEQYAAEDRAEVFRALKPWLVGDGGGATQSEAAVALGWTENAVRVAVHRLRRRFREAVKAEIAQTVATPPEVQVEMRHLLEVLSHRGP